jgi:hypothetical protein
LAGVSIIGARHVLVKRGATAMKGFHLTVLATVLACPLPAYAATLGETWVSRNGLDTATCDVTAPCRTLQVALAKTGPGGQINVMDTGDFGDAPITQSVTIVNATSGTATNVGEGASLGGSPFASVVIAAGATGVVTLRGLVLNAALLGTHVGVLINNANQVNIENCLIVNNPGGGIVVAPSVDGMAQTLATTFNVNIQDSTITGNGNGIKIAPTTATSINVVIDKTRINTNSGGGVRADGTSGGPITVSVSDSSISLNPGNGVNAVSPSNDVIINLTNDVIASNGTAGIQANGGNAAVLVNNTSILNNATGATSAINGGRLLTYGNNRIVGTAGSGFTGPASLQ